MTTACEHLDESEQGKQLTETLKTQLFLEKVVYCVTVLACVAVVDLVVGAHDGACTSTNGIRERPVTILSNRSKI
jgi:hypothetical protein